MSYSEYYPEPPESPEYTITVGEASLVLTYLNSYVHLYRHTYTLMHIELTDRDNPKYIFGHELEVGRMMYHHQWPTFLDQWATDEVYRAYEEFQRERLDDELGPE